MRSWRAHYIGIAILFALLTPHLCWAQAGIVNECDVMEDWEERSWCYVDLAEKQKSLVPCGYLNGWASISQCIDYVKKVKTLTAKDCNDIKNYSQYCLKQLGIAMEDVDVWDQKARDTLDPCVQKLAKYYTPLPRDYSVDDLIVQIKGLRRAVFKTVKDRQEMSIQYNDVMSTCQEKARWVRVNDLLDTIQQQGIRL